MDAGTTLEGVILYQVPYAGELGNNENPCLALTIELLGMEESNFSSDLGGRAKIIQLTFPIAEWTTSQQGPREGVSRIPFSIDLPEWLPASMALAEDIGNIVMLCKYRLIAQLEPYD